MNEGDEVYLCGPEGPQKSTLVGREARTASSFYDGVLTAGTLPASTRVYPMLDTVDSASFRKGVVSPCKLKTIRTEDSDQAERDGN